MKLLGLVIVTLFIAISLALFAVENPGYVLLARPPWSIEMPLTLFAILLLLGMAGLYLTFYLVARIWQIPREVARWRQLRRSRRAQEALTQGLLHVVEGHWAKAEKRLLADLRYNQNPLINYLAAAFAAQGQGDNEKRNEYLSLAHQCAQGHDFAVGMAQAQLHYRSHHYEQALAILNELRAQEPDHPQILRLLAPVYRDLKDWTGLANLLPDVRRHNAMPVAEIEALELQAHRELLIPSPPAGASAVLDKAWSTVPASLREHPILLDIYVRHLIAQQEMDKARKLLEDAIAKQWDEGLVYLFGRVRSNDPAGQLAVAERWFAERGEDATLLLTLGRLALYNNSKAKGREFLERSLAVRELPEAYIELANLLEQAGEADKATQHRLRALKLYSGEEPPRGQKTKQTTRLANTAAFGR